MSIPYPLKYFEVAALPNKPLQKERILEAIGRLPFIHLYNLKEKKTVLGLPDSAAYEVKQGIEELVPGMALKPVANPPVSGRMRLIFAYRKSSETETEWLRELFDINASQGFAAIAVMPIEGRELENEKRKVEKLLGRRATRHTFTSSYTLSGKPSGSLQMENYHESEDAEMLMDVLESLNSSMLKSGVAYRVAIALSGDTEMIEQQLASRIMIVSSTDARCGTYEEIFDKMKKACEFPVGAAHLKPMLCFRASERLSYVIPSAYYSGSSGVPIGSYMKDAVHETSFVIRIEPSTLNMGLMIAGLSGAGKTSCSMSLLEELLKYEKPPAVVIISPTMEWDSFAERNGLRVIRLFDGQTCINFFRCPPNVERQRFYEDLAMILSSASDAGPFENPMEKCLINAFGKIYQETSEPEPAKVYEQIEESIIAFHGKRNNAGVRYTKHGENIKSSLENLRSILARKEYSSKDGIRFEELLDAGVVFDLSRLSNSTKPYMYALILNQLYVLASRFGLENNDTLNLVLCMEEAQLIFKDRESAAVKDIRQRIQDFRKQGVCLMLLTHNVTDIDPTIRRLCQTKLYLKQASDVAATAAKDLVFTYADDDSVIMKLKHLDSRIGALNFVSMRENEKLANDTVFIRTKEYAKK